MSEDREKGRGRYAKTDAQLAMEEDIRKEKKFGMRDDVRAIMNVCAVLTLASNLAYSTGFMTAVTKDLDTLDVLSGTMSFFLSIILLAMIKVTP